MCLSMCTLVFLVTGAGLPQTPTDFPNDEMTAEGSSGVVPRYAYEEKTDPLTDEVTRTLHVGLSVERIDQGLLGAAVHAEFLMLVHVSQPKGPSHFALGLLRTSDKPLGNMFMPKYVFVYRPEGAAAMELPAETDVDMSKLGVFQETVVAEITIDKLLGLLTSPLLRVRGDESSKDLSLSDTDKQAILWFVEKKLPDGPQAVAVLRGRLPSDAK